MCMNEYTRNCPKCNIIIEYKSKSGFLNSLRNNRACKTCSNKNKNIKYPIGSVFYKKCKICSESQSYSNRRLYLQALKRDSKCKACSKNTIRYNGKYERNCSYCGDLISYKSHSTLWDATKHNRRCRKCLSEKKREETLHRLRDKNGNWYSKKACDFIDNLNSKYGYELQHAGNGGEIIKAGYSLDGYDSKRNIVFEYDEPNHNKPKQLCKDLKRQSHIIKRINPTMFIRYSEQYDKLIDVISNKTLP